MSTAANALTLQYATDAERTLFDQKLRSFVPPGSFDAHAHLYVADHPRKVAGPLQAYRFEDYQDFMQSWMGDRAPTAGLFFGFPVRDHDPASDNDLIAGQLTARPDSRGLLLVRPNDDPDAVAARIDREGWLGLKIYHLYASRPDTFNAAMEEFLPEWMWQLADKKGLAIMYHMVRSRALADLDNQREIRTACLRYPSARLILAHAARGFCADHTLEGIHSVADLDNVFFDTSAIAEPGALMAILQRTGTRRLMFGADFPVSQLRGRNVSFGDGFWWAYDTNIQAPGWTLGLPVLNGIDQLLALKQAAHFSNLNDTDIENIFCHNARQILNITPPAHEGPATRQQYQFAKTIIPGGTQLLSKRPEMFAPSHWPAYYTEARGIETFDLDGRRFLDFSITGIGSTLLGMADPDVNAAVARRVALGSMSTLNPPDEVELAQTLLALHPWARMARFTRTGGEAMAAAVRIARAATGRSRVAICGYHGWSDWYIAANLQPSSSPHPTSPASPDTLATHLLPGLEPAGVPDQLAGTTLAFAYNQPQQLQAILDQHPQDIAAIVMEPTRGIDPQDDFLRFVKDAAARAGIVLIFDEITIGWRLATGGAHLHYGVNPDIAVFSKATGNGYPIAAIIGTGPIMNAAQKSFISSTMWTEAIGPAAALATIRKLQQNDVVSHIHHIGSLYQQGMRDLAASLNLPLVVTGRPCLCSIRFDHPDSAALMTLYTRLMLDRRYLAGAGFYPTFAHQPRHVQTFLQQAHDALATVRTAIEQGSTLQRIQGLVKHGGFARLT